MGEDDFLNNLKKGLKKLDDEDDAPKVREKSKSRKQIKKDVPKKIEKKVSKSKKIEKISMFPNEKKKIGNFNVSFDKLSKKKVVKKSSDVPPVLKIKKEKISYNLRNVPTLQMKDEVNIAMDFATKVYQRFNKIIKSVVLFGSTAKQSNVSGSDIDIIIIIDDASIIWDQELIAWYRTELENIIKANPYNKELHINTIKLTTWWEDLIRGDPVVINILRDGESLIDFGGFFEPLKFLLYSGKIKSTPESIYSLLQRAPTHILRSKASEMGSIEGLFWAMVDSSQAALIAAGVQAPSPEHIPAELKKNFVDSGKLKIKYVVWYRDLLILHKKIAHREINDLRGVEIDDWQTRTQEFLEVMARLVNDIIKG